MSNGPKVINVCKYCGISPYGILGIDQMCDGCWEIAHRLGKADLDAKIIEGECSEEYIIDLMKILILNVPRGILD